MMKRFYFIVVFFLFFSKSYSTPISIGFEAGLAIPNNQINNNKITIQDTVPDVIRKGVASGYHLGMSINMGLTENFVFIGGIGLNRFPQSQLTIFYPKGEKFEFDTIILKSVQNIVPVSVGVNWFIFRSVLSPYISGNLEYNYIQNSLEIEKLDVPIPILTSKTDNRIGAGIGVGTDIDLGLLSLNFDVKYHFLNLIGKTDGEPEKKYLTVSFGIIFGSR